MNSLREIKGRLRSIRKNRQILNAMKMVSTVQLRRIQEAAQASRPYARRLEMLVRTLLDLPEGCALQHPLLERRRARRMLWVVISTDRGLCGSLNANLFRFVQQALRERTDAKSALALLLIGRKACDFFKRAQAPCPVNALCPDGKAADFRIEQAYPLAEAQAEIITRRLCDLYREGQVDQVDLFYAQGKSILRQIPVRAPILPMVLDACPPGDLQKRSYLFEPSPGIIAEDLLPRYLVSRVRQILFEAQVAEHSARMVTMDQAGKNASDMIDRIQMNYNTLRQGMITRELADITTGVEAMA